MLRLGLYCVDPDKARELAQCTTRLPDLCLTAVIDPVEPRRQQTSSIVDAAIVADSWSQLTDEQRGSIDAVLFDPSAGSAQRMADRGIPLERLTHLLVTHHHPDHTGNNQAFASQAATVIGLEKLKQLMVSDPRTKDIPGPPTTTFAKDYTLAFGGASVEAHFYGASHTGGDTVVYLPDRRFVMVSDTIPVANPTPGIGFGGNGEIGRAHV